MRWAFALLIMTAVPVQAREILFGQGKESISVPFGVETLFRFPSEVKTVTEAGRFEIRPASPEEPDYSVLLVKPRMSEGASDVTFLLADGGTVKTQLLITRAPNGKRDSVYDFRPYSGLMETDPQGQPKKDPLVISELDLMRGMIRGDQVAGFDVKRHDLSISLGEQSITTRLVKRYLGKDVNGYVYELRSNDSKKVFEIDLRGLSIGNPNLAVLAQVDRTRLQGKEPESRQTFLRVVARPGASSRQMTLPVSIERKGK
ncbi:MAG: hypothetical protein AAB425_00925 [Bdellovibrionota bacterium]